MMNATESLNKFGESDQIYVYTVLVTTVQQILSIFGIVLNSTLVYITVKHKSGIFLCRSNNVGKKKLLSFVNTVRSLHRSYGFLLAICSLCDAICESATPLATVLVYLRRRIPLLTCFYAQFFAPTAFFNSGVNLFLISIDRIAALAFPVLYRNVLRSTGKIIIIANVFSLSIAFYMLYLSLIFAVNHPEIMVYCEPGDILQDTALAYTSFLLMFFNLAAVVLYIIMGIMLKILRRSKPNGTSSNNSSHQSQLEITRRIFKSLAVIMAVIFFLWFMSPMIVTMVVPQLFVNDPSLIFLFARLAAQLSTFAGVINAPVLYICSSEYREIMENELRLVKVLCSLRIQISFTTPKPSINHNAAAVIVTRTHQNSNKINYK